MMVKAMKQVALSEIKDDLSKYLRLAENQQIIITRHGKPAGVLVGFASEDDWLDYKLENDPRFLQRIARARKSIQTGKGIKLEDVQLEPKALPRRTAISSRKSRGRTAGAD
jgi:prevent-host-death family protein